MMTENKQFVVLYIRTFVFKSFVGKVAGGYIDLSCNAWVTPIKRFFTSVISHEDQSQWLIKKFYLTRLETRTKESNM